MCMKNRHVLKKNGKKKMAKTDETEERNKQTPHGQRKTETRRKP